MMWDGTWWYMRYRTTKYIIDLSICSDEDKLFAEGTVLWIEKTTYGRNTCVKVKIICAYTFAKKARAEENPRVGWRKRWKNQSTVEPLQAIGGGDKKNYQISFNLCLNERSTTFCGFKKYSTISQLNSDIFLRFFRVRS